MAPPAVPVARPAFSWKSALLVLVAGAVALVVLLGARRHQNLLREQAPVRTLAVLPLTNVSGDASQEYFADGMTQELTTELAQVGDVRVIRWLDNAYQGRSECMILLKADPRLDAVRSDPRYQTLLHRVGLGD